MKIRRITPAIGAELVDVDLAQAARDEGLYLEIRAQLLQHKVLFLREQAITRAEHVTFARRFGELEDHPVAGSDPQHPGLVLIHRSDKKEAYENSFHADGMWRPNPAMGAVLRCIECPPIGGDTIWVNMVRAYENLPEHIKQLIGPLRAANSIEHSFGAVMEPEARRKLGRDHPPVEHPVVRTHPETGEKSLFVSGFTTHFLNFHTPQNVRFGLDKAPGAALLLNYLISQATVPEYQVRWSWRPNDVAIWDNRCTTHYAVHDYWPAPRRMERAGIVGDVPF
ncbi:MAG: TauD/TfdA family dioxygenase [Rubrivivax sp.]